MGQEQSKQEIDWNFLIGDAIQHGWVIEKKGELVILEPPPFFIHANKSAIWKKMEYMGRLVSVPDHIQWTHIRHNEENLSEEPEIDWEFLIMDAMQHGWVLQGTGRVYWLEPPDNFLYSLYTVERNYETYYKGRCVKVPSYVTMERVRHNSPEK